MQNNHIELPTSAVTYKFLKISDVQKDYLYLLKTGFKVCNIIFLILGMNEWQDYKDPYLSREEQYHSREDPYLSGSR